MTATVDPAAKQMARFVVMYDTPSDVDAFERHYNRRGCRGEPGPLRDLPGHDPAARRGLIADAASARW
jgi:hypothetical protein